MLRRLAKGLGVCLSDVNARKDYGISKLFTEKKLGLFSGGGIFLSGFPELLFMIIIKLYKWFFFVRQKLNVC